ncbi:16S rRNA (adenine(1518)-N(6)/adenine(1519)-N(6))-dimethyltransferase RsmA [Candidatus Profftia tarda]|uniref:Ribosomal RNA small subunit methyltransferase A n=1 Tax=Candidatus Profftia tarda TaxID=1177216 RepID=A0A8E4GI66_9ENTR|nr:16S rRNA (adenine(1518)-N(6)/adenine(1519)-N(6))-dimethyltransferase RsmA [Candidatus Profftia tarda]CAD6508117.1 Ribosomal RNA small subunit methyltransferase A [Candidatus Profftia tarda]
MNKIIRQYHIPRKRYGQNFLINQYIIDRIVSAINPMQNQAMVEIGPGLGALTKNIVNQISPITVIEIDRDLADQLARNPLIKKKVNILKQDAMTVDFYKLSCRLGQMLRIFGNLPYNISTPLIFHLFNYIPVIIDLHLMLQKEVVNRLVATPNNKNYGRLTIMTQYYCQVIPLMEVPPKAFRPVPNVNSSLVRLIPHKIIPYPVKDILLLRNITKSALNQRRKKVRNSLGHMFTTKQLTLIGIDPDQRAENISIESYCKLTNWLCEQK